MPLRERPPAGRPTVCIVHHAYYPQHGHVRRDAETLTRQGYDVTVIALQQPGQPRRDRVHGVDVYRLPLTHQRGSVLHYLLEYGRLLGLSFLTLTKLHLRKRFQVVEIDNMPDVLVFSAIVPKLMGAKVILYIFDNMPELYMLTRRVDDRHPLVRLLTLLERLSARFADHVIVTHETAREIVRSRGVPASKLSVVLNGPDEAIFTPRPRREREGDDGTFEIATHGTILERYGIHVLVDALQRVVREVPNVHVTVFGEGEQRAALERNVHAAGLTERVRFAGWVPLDDLLDALSEADLGYVGMLCNNMLSNKLMEYVAMRVPVVVARWPTYEQYFDGDSVTYFEAGSADSLAEAVVEVYRGRSRAQRRAERAATLFQRYRWAVQRHVYCAIYETLLGRTAGRLAHEPSPATISRVLSRTQSDGRRFHAAR
jgi:glycosyltransferase involved in cell wall biosynthesis